MQFFFRRKRVANSIEVICEDMRYNALSDGRSDRVCQSSD